MTCVSFWKNTEKVSKKKFACRAYPDGIPMAISLGVVQHEHPHIGDHDIHYEPIKR
jgi:hypothetical protein